MSFSQILALAEAGHTLYEILDFVGAPMFGYKDKGLPWPKPGQFKGSMRNPKIVSEYKPMPNKSEMKKSLPVGEANPRKRPSDDPYPSPAKTPKKQKTGATKKRKGSTSEPVAKKPRLDTRKKKKMNSTVEGQVVEKYQTLVVNPKYSKISKGLKRQAGLNKVTTYGGKITSGGNGFMIGKALRPSISVENFLPDLETNAKIIETGFQDGWSSNQTSNLDDSLMWMDPNFDPAHYLSGEFKEIRSVGNTNFVPTLNNYYRIRSQTIRLDLKNLTNLPARVKIYWCVPKEHTVHSPAQAFWRAIAGQKVGQTIDANQTDQGIAPLTGLNDDTQCYMKVGYHPKEYREWNQSWSVLKEEKHILVGGQLTSLTCKLKYNKVFSQKNMAKVLENMKTPPTIQGTNIKGYSVIPFITVEGYVTEFNNNVEGQQTIGFGNFNISYALQAKTKVDFFTSENKYPFTRFENDGLRQGSAINFEEFINDEGAIQVGTNV